MKPGYKQTEVGVIPEEWGNTSLCELVDQTRKITYGIVVPGPAIYDGVPLIRAQDYSKGWVDLEDLYRVSHTVDKAYKRSKVITGDVLLTIVGSVGNIAKVPQTFDGSNITQQTARLSFNPEVADADYYLNVLMSDVGRKAIANFTKSGVQPSLNLSDVEKFILPHPPLPEQRAIATALSDVDGLLGGLDRLIAKKRDLKQAAMQQLLTGQTRLPGFQGGWEVKRISDLADVKTGPFGSSLHESDYVPDGTPIITVEHLGEFGVENLNVPMVSESDRRRLQAYSLETGDIVFSRVGSVDRNALIRPSEAGWLFSGRLLRVRLDRRQAYAPFLSHQFHSAPFKALVRSVAVGQTMASQNTQILKGINVSLPTLAEQTAIASALSDMDAELTALEARRDKTRALKQAMMQELLTGRTRLV